MHFCVDTLYDVIFFAKSTQYLIFINFLSSKMKILKILLSGFAQSSVTVLPCIGYLLLFPNFLVTDSLSYLHMRFVSGLLTLQNWRGVGPPLPPTLFVILGVNKGVIAKSCFRVLKRCIGILRGWGRYLKVTLQTYAPKNFR